jgi:RHS repeat-associated protein
MQNARQPYLTDSDIMELHYGPQDHLGSTRAVIQREGASVKVVESMMYQAYGKMIPLAVQTDPVRMTFTTKEFDNESGMGLYYFGKRYYDAEIGLWSSCDPKAQFWSRYSYTGNGINPIIGFDPDGAEVNFIFITSKGAEATNYNTDAVIGPLSASKDFMDIFTPMQDAKDKVFNVYVITDLAETSPGEVGFVERSKILHTKNEAGENALEYPMGVAGARDPAKVGGTIFHEMFHRFQQAFKKDADYKAQEPKIVEPQKRVEQGYKKQ